MTQTPETAIPNPPAGGNGAPGPAAPPAKASFTLPTAKTAPKSAFADLTTFVYGPPKIGKSTLASQFPGALFLATEAGLNHLETYQIPISSWDDFIRACALILQGKHEFRTIVIDTADNLYRYCTDQICKKHGVETVGDIAGFGKGFALLNNEFHRVLTKLTQLPYGLVLISHSKQIELEDRGGKYNKTVPTLPEGARKTVLGMADVILYCTQTTGRNEANEPVEQRVIITKPSRLWEAGDRTGRLPEVMPLDFQAFKAAWLASAAKKQ
jgi:hypothetical protein